MPARSPDTPPPRTLVVATTNRHKLAEMAALLDGLGWAIVPVTAYIDAPAPAETGRTFAENARLKARYYGALADRAALADRRALVDRRTLAGRADLADRAAARAPGGPPDPRTDRAAGRRAPGAAGRPATAGDPRLLTVAEDSGLAIDRLDGAPGIHSARFNGATWAEKFAALYARGAAASPARFVCAVAAAAGDRIVFETIGTIDGRIAPAPAGTGGFGYDPIFFYPPWGCTLAEVSADRKAAVSHRGHAFRRLRTFLAAGAGYAVR